MKRTSPSGPLSRLPLPVTELVLLLAFFVLLIGAG